MLRLAAQAGHARSKDMHSTMARAWCAGITICQPGSRGALLLINLEAWHTAGHRACGDHDVLRRQRGLATFLQVHLDFVLANEAAPALDILHFVLLEEPLDATCQALHGLGFLLHHGAEVYAEPFNVDAVVFEVRARVVVLVGVLEQRLRMPMSRYATLHDAGASQNCAHLHGLSALLCTVLKAERQYELALRILVGCATCMLRDQC